MSAPDRVAMRPLAPGDGPVFDEPWQAEAFALAVCLNESGLLPWSEWAETLGAVLRDAGAADDGARYYEHWLEALEQIAAARGLARPDELAARKAAWADSYRRTPHGQPVGL